MKSAEWVCTNCQTINRALVAEGATQGNDKCVVCRRRHAIVEDERPVRWKATASS
jgi:hypothetical protein